MVVICFITAIYGEYETACKPFVKQTIDTDFICFTDNKDICSNGWRTETTPYHLTHKSEMDDDTLINSLCNNKHTSNITKYYKQSFCNIPILQGYDVVVWIDGSVEIIYDKTSEYIVNHIYTEKIIGWHHATRYGALVNEVFASHYYKTKYDTTYWNNQEQPIQDLFNQYNCYIDDGYSELYYKIRNSHTPHFGVWITCFVAFLHKDTAVRQLLDMWYLQTLKYTTQDRVGFSYVCQKTETIPFTLPNSEIHGDRPHDKTMFYIKHKRGELVHSPTRMNHLRQLT
jgi:hypothetical protein